MFVFNYHQVKQLDEQRRRRSLTRYEASRSMETTPAASPVAEVFEMTFPEDCCQAEQMGA